MIKEFPIIFIVGPTCTGKTEVSIELAGLINADIISADSMQVYKGLDIGTAKPAVNKLSSVSYHLTDILDISEDCNVSVFCKEALACIKDILSWKKNVIVAGGTGMYIKSLIDGIVDSVPANRELRNKILKEKDKPILLYEELEKVDPEAAKKIHPNNIRRVLRALEFFYTMGKKFSSETMNWKKPGSKKIMGKKYRIFGLLMDRPELYRCINNRVDKMIKLGLVKEAERVLKDSGFKDSTAAQAIGYKEFIPYFKKESTLEQTVEDLKKNTRNFAKRQMTWFRKEKRIEWINVNGETKPEEVACKIMNTLEKSRKE